MIFTPTQPEASSGTTLTTGLFMFGDATAQSFFLDDYTVRDEVFFGRIPEPATAGLLGLAGLALLGRRRRRVDRGGLIDW